MYPSSNNCTYNPISFSGQNIHQRPLFNSDINPNPKFEDPHLNPNPKFEDPHLTSLYHLPSPYIEYEDAVNDLTWQQLHDLFIQLQPLTGENSVVEIVNPMEDQNKDLVDGLLQDWNRKCESMAEKVTGNRPSKKDRHSKINTAHGLRDRRMRLSLDVARKFFDLQDILGFDKASKTVEWLLIQSSSAIKEIMRGLPQKKHSGANTSASSTSECEVVSGIDDSIPDTTNYKKQASISVKTKVKSSCNKEKAAKLARRTALHSLARESRKVARERARKRTIEKRRLGDQSKLCLEPNSDVNQLGCWGTQFETVEESGTQDHKINPSYEGLTEVEELNSRERRILENREYGDGDNLVITSNWNPSSIFNNHQISEISHEHQFSDFQFCSKTWEVFYNMSLGG